jgi:vesicle-associated membrane protein 72
MPLVYSFVSRGDVVLCDHAAFSGNFDTVALQCLQNVKNPDAKFTITCDGHTFNFLNHEGYTYLVVADEAYGREIPLAFLERVREQFHAKYADKGRTAAVHSLDKVFGYELGSPDLVAAAAWASVNAWVSTWQSPLKHMHDID